jgi:streptomycin 6-kinase
MDELWPIARECAAEWGLTLEEPFETPRSLVVPAGEVVLKVNADWHYEAEHEADALALWNGRGAARLLARDDERRALLIERCIPGTPLWDAGEDEIAVVRKLLPRLSLEPDAHPFRSVADEADRWIRELPKRYEPSRLLDAALHVFRTVDRDAHYLVNQDLHGGNVLRAEREPWLVVDPKPLVGEREVDAVGLLRNADDPRRWVDALAELGYERERLWGWGFAHALAWGNVAEAEKILAASGGASRLP